MTFMRGLVASFTAVFYRSVMTVTVSIFLLFSIFVVSTSDQNMDLSLDISMVKYSHGGIFVKVKGQEKS